MADQDATVASGTATILIVSMRPRIRLGVDRPGWRDLGLGVLLIRHCF